MEDLQLCIAFGYEIFWVYSFKTKKERKKINLIKLIHDISEILQMMAIGKFVLQT